MACVILSPLHRWENLDTPGLSSLSKVTQLTDGRGLGSPRSGAWDKSLRASYWEVISGNSWGIRSETGKEGSWQRVAGAQPCWGPLWEPRTRTSMLSSSMDKKARCLHSLPISTGWRLLPLAFLAQWLQDQRELSRKGYSFFESRLELVVNVYSKF